MGLYELYRKFTKWRKKVFYRVLMMVVVNAWVIYKENTKKSFLQFLVPFAKEMIFEGKKTAFSLTILENLALAHTQARVSYIPNSSYGRSLAPLRYQDKMNTRQIVEMIFPEGLQR